MSSISADFGEETCPIHNINKGVICHDCSVRICYKCGLFGQHKGHENQDENDFYRDLEHLRHKINKNLKKIIDAEDLL